MGEQGLQKVVLWITALYNFLLHRDSLHSHVRSWSSCLNNDVAFCENQAGCGGKRINSESYNPGLNSGPGLD